MLSISKLNKSYRANEGGARRLVLNDVTLVIGRGECVAIMGESGVGKSTLLNLIAGLELPDSGQIAIEGVDLTALAEPELTLLRRAKIGFVFQAFHLLPYLSVAANVGLPLALIGMSAVEANERVHTLLASVGLGDRVSSSIQELSGGEAQRVAVARALIHRPALVLADEPTGNLDADSAVQVLELLRDRTKEVGAALLLVTHSARAARLMDRALQLTAAGLQSL